MPIEAMARRGEKSLAFGPMRPVGLVDPRDGKRPFAVVQLRQDNLIGSSTISSASRPTCVGVNKSGCCGSSPAWKTPNFYVTA
ncbi:MAG: hypothetical protein M5U34_38770 [Chloroflexi bacterium]|nr:hypothetical protein [Chloroflexota bacterium]